MKLLKNISLFSILTVLLFSLSISNADAKGNVTVIKSPVILKINQYYILYTSPDVPYIDKQQRFMIPLRAVSELLGAKVDYDAVNKKSTVSWENKNVEVTINSNNVKYNGNNTKIDTVPVLKEKQVFIPAKVLLDGLNIKGSWEDQLLTITDTKFKKSKVISYLEGGYDLNPIPLSTDINTNKIRPLSYELTLPTADSNPRIAKITVEARNISGKDLKIGSEDLRPTFITDISYQYDKQDRDRPAVQKGAIFKRTWNNIDLSSTSSSNNYQYNPLKYIIVVGNVTD
ncbi:stalk domain-containing protein [Paenibacillus terrae]|uniref:Peptidylprolyl isomerase n=1 Tax=Paenibacillus terrae TaxID=159743 RepID=A0A0D7WU00_9BACL|nr:stalk domain-containing protein [Paenibacillus terrae]KJD42656.1 peptidylprolyl isomerase [Paenibacillus terrae]